MTSKRVRFIFYFLALFLTSIFCAKNHLCILGEDFSLTIIHTNDSHGNFNAEPYLKTLEDEKKKNGENVLVVSAGDVFIGSLSAQISHGQSIAKIMDTAGYDYIVPGNHDFEYGINGLKNIASQKNFKILASNLVDQNTGQIIFTPYEIKEFDGVKIGIFGLSTPETVINTHNEENLYSGEFLFPVETAKKIVSELKSRDCEIIIAITHLGLDESSLDENRSDYLAQNVSGIDVIIDGHSHTELKNGLKINDTLIAQTGEKGENIGIINLKLGKNTNGALKLDKQAYLVNLQGNYKQNIAPNQNVLTVIKNENQKIQNMSSKVIGNVPFILDGGEHTQKEETNFYNLITDAILEGTNSDIAILDSRILTGSISGNPITVGDIYKSFVYLPFNKIVASQNVSGKTILEALEYGVSEYPNLSKSNIHVAGIKFKFDPNRKIGTKVYDVRFIKNSKSLDVNENYKLATTESLFYSKKFTKNQTYKEYIPIEEMLIDYIKSNKDLSKYKTVQNRIVMCEQQDKQKNIFEYQIKKGDTLWKIAIKFDTSVERLAELNKIKDQDLIYAGDILKID